MKLGQVLTVGSVFDVIEMELRVDAIVSPVGFKDEDTELVELAIAPEDEDKYPFVRPTSAPADLMDRPGRVIGEWENMDFDERIQADPTYIDRV
ncbi:hypothetical protein BCD67_21870 [Oscillatoriales cyanobacterium USR001]|nr:hypothetical protein BCD67_21870 [Oscillatoriales cyanobacterium USR001]